MTQQVEDLLAAAAVIAPAKGVRSELENAASIAGLLLITRSLFAAKPKTSEAHRAVSPYKRSSEY